MLFKKGDIVNHKSNQFIQMIVISTYEIDGQKMVDVRYINSEHVLIITSVCEFELELFIEKEKTGFING